MTQRWQSFEISSQSLNFGVKRTGTDEMAKKTIRTDADRRVRQCERLGRLLRVLQLIMSKGRWDADGLAEELGCSRRTVYRLLQTLSMAGVPWYFDDKCRAYRVRPGYRFPAMEKATNANIATATSPHNLGPLVEKLITDGEAFSTSLQTLLDTLNKLRHDS
jgi:biotin operon repressor